MTKKDAAPTSAQPVQHTTLDSGSASTPTPPTEDCRRPKSPQDAELALMSRLKRAWTP